MITEKLARFVIETRVSEVPDEILAGSRDALIDTVGVALAGTLEPVGEIALRWVNELGARPQTSLWGLSVATSPAEAAFANGICAHALDFDDSLPSLRGHPSATMVPAALAVGEVTGASGAKVWLHTRSASKSPASSAARWVTGITCAAGTRPQRSVRSPRRPSPCGCGA